MNYEALSPEFDRRMRIHVERIVRPIAARESRKDRMREELLAHLTAAFVELRADTSDDVLALIRAKERLGASSEITVALRGAVPRFERVLFASQSGPTRIERWAKRKSGEAIWRFALRNVALCAGAMIGSVLVAVLLALGGVGLSRANIGIPWRRVGMSAPVWFGLISTILGAAFVVPFLSEAASAAWRARPRRYLVVGGGALTCLLLVAVIATAFRAAIYGSHYWAAWGPDLKVFIGLVAVSPVVFVLVTLTAASERRRYERWTGLDLAEG